MNWEELTKEQKQMALLVGIVSTTLLATLFQFVIKPAFANAGQAREELVKLRADIAQADTAFKKEHLLVAESAEMKKSMDRAIREYIPSYGNTLSWATERLYTLARTVGVSIESMAGGGVTWGGAPDPAQKGGRAFVSFSAQLMLQCSYAELLRFLQAVERDNPLVCPTSLAIEGREQTPEKHRVNLTLEWPTWARAPVPPAAPAAPGKAAPAPLNIKPDDRRKSA